MAKKKKKKRRAAPPPPPEPAAATVDDAPPAVPEPPARPDVPGGWGVAAVIALGALLLYAITVQHGFTLDDVTVVRDNPVLIRGSWSEALTSSYWPAYLKTGASNWRPIASLSWLLDRVGMELGPPDTERAAVWAARHHAMNAVWHGIVVLCCFPVARRLLGSVRGAWIACVLFAVHPAHTEVVAPVVGRTDLLAAAGVLAMCAAFWRWRDTGRPLWLAAATAAFAFGLGGKESAAPLVLWLPLADLWLRDKSWRWWLGRPAWGYLPFAVVLLLYFIARGAVLGDQSLVHSQAVELGAWGRVAFMGHNSWISAWLLVLPVRFHHVMTTVPSDAPFTFPPPSAIGLVIWPALLVPLWGGWAWLRRRAPFGALCWLAVLLPWIPTSGLLPAAAGVSMRFLFISTAFAAIGAVAAGRWWLARRPGTGNWLLGLAAVWAVAGTVLTVRRIPAWENNGTFHAAVLAEVPGCFTSNYSLGAYIAEHGGSVAEARVWFERAIAIAGDSDRSINARVNYATSFEFGPSNERYGADAPLERALAEYEAALRVKPDSANAALNAGVVCEKLAGRAALPQAARRDYRDRARRFYLRAMEIQPGHPDRRVWHRVVAQLAEQLGRTDEARRHFRAAAAARVEAQPKMARVHGPAAGAEERKQAIHELERALALEPPPDEAAALRAELQAWRAR
ncbi:MAG: hypothetical protein ACYTGX_12925 [Planctomycetota bacterium]|jgi:hypothetical protein